ncbi:DEAD/DEAH box helicase [Clostridium rectalis]|uniref:DEAD/DEAH box helicase n=1 Tax=Clostridium rectalis TaxID=2040295 RepID=UPI001FAA5DC8|nr:DEAD/DEAH box helicase [Clostridium rectalis]
MRLKTDLFKHQKRAVEKLAKIKVGALYMEMGTGKTRTALELIKTRLENCRVNHIIWLCPCSVKESLKRDIKKHSTGDLSMFTICGIETLSSSIRANSILLKLVLRKNCYLIVDESNLVKNHRAKRTENIMRLAEHCKYKLILNGTPISRNEKDLFSQWYILDWRILGYQGFWSFAANHLEYDKDIPGKITRCLNTDYLVRKILPYTYQVKKDVCLDLPQKTYDTKYYYLTDEQNKNYRYVADELMFLVDEMEPHTIYRLFTGLQNVICGFKLKITKDLKFIKEPMFENPLDNPRIQMLLDILKIYEKTIIFCKYTKEVKDITVVLNKKYGEGSAVSFYGELNQKERQKNLELFKNKAQFFVANKTCAGYGLNLQFCSYIIYYSNDWDYATRAQSEDRIHRIGQSKTVHIVDICAAYTLDERILNCLLRKENLVDSFKKRIEIQKDDNFKYIHNFIYKRNYNGNRYIKQINNLDKSDLMEVL